MNDNLAMQMIEEEVKEGFIINNDNLAEWALRKIAAEQVDSQRYINVCDTMIAEYNLKKQKALEQLESKTGYLKLKLQEYFAVVPHSATKTQETYKLPSGTLKKKFGGNDFVRDETAFIKWLKDNGHKDKVRVEETANWGEFKKTIKVVNDKVVTNDGEVVEGVTVKKKPDTFEVEI